MERSLVRISKFLSRVLRHRPDSIGLLLDEGGYAKVDDLLAAANRSGMPLDMVVLRKVVEENEKQRFAFSDDGLRIRASQGHSISVDLGLVAVEPPELLYHGTAVRFLKSIRRDGLLRGKRHHVHLSPDIETALKVGSRHGPPVVLAIDAGRMQKDGFSFYRSTNGVWLTDHVPVRYIEFPENLDQ
jgi:putative RNA 2'-phosphotransferase